MHNKLSNKNLNLITSLFLFLAIMIAGCGIFRLGKPSWVKQTPVNSGYYIGIGVTDKKNDNYIQIAKNQALNQISSEISVSLKGTFINKVTADNETVKNHAVTNIKTMTMAELEGYEMVDSWQDEE